MWGEHAGQLTDLPFPSLCAHCCGQWSEPGFVRQLHKHFHYPAISFCLHLLETPQLLRFSHARTILLPAVDCTCRPVGSRCPKAWYHVIPLKSLHQQQSVKGETFLQGCQSNSQDLISYHTRKAITSNLYSKSGLEGSVPSHKYKKHIWLLQSDSNILRNTQ